MPFPGLQLGRRLALVLALFASGVTMARAQTLAPAAGATEWHSQGGVLDVTLVAAPGKITLGGLVLDGMVYNGQYVGPLLRVRPGDLLRVRLVNHLTEPTNLHFHGIRTSPLGNSDNVHISVAAGASFTYDIRIPVTQPPGLYWYHSHLHGHSEHQVMGGLSGALLVESLTPAPAAPAERIFVLKDLRFDDDIGNKLVDDELHGVVQSINGELDRAETMGEGETQLWRFSNQSADQAFHLSLAGHPWQVVGRDGGVVTGAPPTETLDIMPAERVDVLVTGGAAGRYALLSKSTLTGTGAARRTERELGHLTVTEAPGITAPVVLPPVPARDDLRTLPIAERRTIVFSQTAALDPAKQKFFINGKLYDAERIDIRLPLGNVEEWTLRNDSDDLHVFHIHQLGFQVTEVNGVKMPLAGQVDTVRVPERGEVKIRLAFTDPLIVGRFIFHCHVLSHEDKGMMANIEIYDPRPSPLMDRVRRFYFHIWWWMHGVPWSLCGLGA